MTNIWEKLAGASSILLRICTFVFLRWIPGHHFPRTIIAALVAYLSIILANSHYFGSGRAKLHELFPALFVHEEVIDVDTGEKTEVDIEVYYEEPVFYKDEHPFLKTLLCGIPDWREKGFSYLTIGVNILLGLFTLDLVLRGPALYPGDDLTFTRVGFVDSTSAKILVREPDTKQLPIYTYYKLRDTTNWSESDRIYYVDLETDYTYALILLNLQSDSAYEYATSNNLTGTFRTAPAIDSPASNTLTFLTSSCIKANFPYNPFSHSLAIHGFEYLSNLITSLPSPPAFMLFLGDFIYVDVPQRLASTVSHYRSEYRRVYKSPSWSLPGINSVPWLHTLDDHEIANDWSGGNQTSPFPEASDPFINYHVSVNPPIPPSSVMGADSNTTYFEFTRGPASFFLLDTRRYRTNPDSLTTSSKPLYGSSDTSSNPPPPKQHASMLGPTQLDDLLRFINRPEPPGVHWKIIASSVPFTKNWRFGTPDTWGGFLHERAAILDAMHRAEHVLQVRVVILSGDRHEFAAVRFPRQLPPKNLPDIDRLSKSVTGQPPQKPLPIPKPEHDPTPQAGPHEFSVGPLSMFYLPLRTFKQIDDEDVALAYFPDGNSKIGMVEIGNLAAGRNDAATAGGGGGGGGVPGKQGKQGNKVGKVNDGVQLKSWLKYSLWIDGVVKWEYMLMSPGPG